MNFEISRKAQKLLILSGVFGPIFFFITLTILGLLWNGYNPITTGMSEIGAVDSPFKDIMNYLGFSLLGFTIIVFAIGFKIYFNVDLQPKIGYIFVLVGGIFMFSVGFLPCDSQCIDVTLTGELHSLTSMFSAILIPLGIMISAYPISKKWGKIWGYSSFCFGILSLTSGPIMFIEVLNTFTGLIQRLGIGLSLLWIFLTSLKIFKELQE